MENVVFNSNEFKALYPQFANTDDYILGNYFNSACLLCDNSDRSLVVDLEERKTLLYLLTCHIAILNSKGDTLVGMLTGATEGKVSVSVQPFANANWYNSTQFGMLYWQATAKYRLGMRYYGGNCQ